MSQTLLASTVLLSLSLGANLSVQAQTTQAPGTATAPGTTTAPTQTNSNPTPSFFAPGTNPSGSINYNQSTTINSSGFSVPSNTLPRTNSIYNSTTPNSVYNSAVTSPNGTINAFPPYNPYTIAPPQSIYNPSIGNTVPSINTPSNGFGTIR
jgi:hypothetical protein